jgi:serine/threonine protein kinase
MGLCFVKPLAASTDWAIAAYSSSALGNFLSRRSAVLLTKEFGFSRTFAEDYELGEELGRGTFGRTYIASTRKVRGSTRFAVKVISKMTMTTQLAVDDVVREVEILKLLRGHKNIVYFIDAYENSQSVFIVMELCQGGDLNDHIVDKGGMFDEESAIGIVKQILHSVQHMHEHGVVHRDLKPENFMLSFMKHPRELILKAIDFGLSDICKEGQRLNDTVGTPYFVAPEVLNKDYGTKADTWSIGVVTFMLLMGHRPFFGRNETEIFMSVLNRSLLIDEMDLSAEARDFLKVLLDRNEQTRLSANEALSHPWLSPLKPCGRHDARLPGVNLGLLVQLPALVSVPHPAQQTPSLRVIHE